MDLTEDLLKRLAHEILGSPEFEFNGVRISLQTWSRYSMKESIRQFWPGDALPAPRPEELESLPDLARLCRRWNDYARSRGLDPVSCESGDSRGLIWAALFDAVVERHLIQPTIIYDYPLELSPLSKTRPEDPLAGGTVRALHRRDGNRQRLQRAQRSRGAASDVSRLRRSNVTRGTRKPTGWMRTTSEPFVTGCLPPPGRGSASIGSPCSLPVRIPIRDVILFPLLRPEKKRP